MDSIVGALGMAYYLTLKEKVMWVPLVNCKKDELKLRPEIYSHIIEDCGLDMEDIMFYDEMLSYNASYLEFALIDHNKIEEN